MLLLTVTANAYIDPSVTTYAIQAIAGVIIAVGAVAGIIWTKMKKKAKEKLNIDLEGKKKSRTTWWLHRRERKDSRGIRRHRGNRRGSRRSIRRRGGNRGGICCRREK